MSEVTQILNSYRRGGEHDEEETILEIYNELRVLARQKMGHEASDHTLQPTALVHEAWLRLMVSNPRNWQNRSHFFAAASEAMRRILVDHARRKHRLKRGGNSQHDEIVEDSIVLMVPAEELLAVDEAVGELAKEDPQVAELVKLRYFVGMTMVEAASTMGLAPRTAERLWTFGRTWLRNEIRLSPPLAKQ